MVKNIIAPWFSRESHSQLQKSIGKDLFLKHSSLKLCTWNSENCVCYFNENPAILRLQQNNFVHSYVTFSALEMISYAIWK